jgi:monoamine oxidase
VFEARDRIGGRVWTTRAAPLAPHYGELGGELVDADHRAIRTLCKEFRLRLKPVLLRGFGLAYARRRGVRVVADQSAIWRRFSTIFRAHADAFEQVDGEWVSSTAAAIARVSIANVLDAANAPDNVRAQATGLRNFLVADPDQLSALVAAALVLDGDFSKTAMYHIVGGNDQLVDALAGAARCEIRLRHVVRAVSDDDDRVEAAVEGPNGKLARIRADYVVMAVPVPLLREMKFTPPLPAPQRQAIDTLETGLATKALLRFSRAWWRRPGTPRAFGTNLDIGAVWDVGEAQRNAPLLSVLGGGRASAGLQGALRDGPQGIVRRLAWLGRATEIPQAHVVTWENDPWARGAYAYFSQRFDPALRPLLARAHGRVFFAGCHTSRDYQGYMNGAVESGIRVAGEIALARRIR